MDDERLQLSENPDAVERKPGEGKTAPLPQAPGPNAHAPAAITRTGAIA
jgi:hypothetical protein